MKSKRSILIVLFILVSFMPAIHTGSHTINGYPSSEDRQALQDDFDNANTELEDWDNYIEALDDLRDQHVAKLLYLHGQWLGTQSSIRNQQISALTGSAKTNIIDAVASAYGITVKIVTAMYSAYSLEDLIVYELGQANVLASDIDANWDNSVTFEGTDEANSIMEAYRDLVAAVNHYNSHSSTSKKKAGDPPIKPTHPDLPKFPCGGSCNLEFDTPDSPHDVSCGTARNVYEEAVERVYMGPGSDSADIVANLNRIVSEILQIRSPADGCGRQYYNCSSDEAKHRRRTCTKWVYEREDYYGAPLEKRPCGTLYRRCMGKRFDHHPDIPGASTHSDNGDSSTESTASNPVVVDNSPDCDYCTTGMCSACPITYACGIHAVGTSGYHVSYTCNEGACNNRVYWGCVYAQCPETSSHGTTTITSGPAIGPCGHTYWLGSSSDYDHRSETWGCGHTIYACQSSSHALQASCSITNIWGHSCTVTNFYACSSHTHTFPTFSCGRSACTQQVADPNRHRIWCINGHEYWSCDTTALYWHQTRGPCTRRKLKSPGVRGPCGESWALCYRNGQSCMDYYRRIRFHEPRQ